MAVNDGLMRLELNYPVFQEQLLQLHKPDRLAAIGTLKKVRQLTWVQLSQDNILKWGKIVSFKPPSGIDATYTLRITRSRRCTAVRDGDYMRFLTIAPDHDSTYGRK